MDAPDVLYYQCTSHPAMFGTINILNAQTALALNDLTDVDAVSNATNGYILKYNGSTSVSYTHLTLPTICSV